MLLKKAAIICATMLFIAGFTTNSYGWWRSHYWTTCGGGVCNRFERVTTGHCGGGICRVWHTHYHYHWVR